MDSLLKLIDGKKWNLTMVGFLLTGLADAVTKYQAGDTAGALTGIYIMIGSLSGMAGRHTVKKATGV